MFLASAHPWTADQTRPDHLQDRGIACRHGGHPDGDRRDAGGGPAPRRPTTPNLLTLNPLDPGAAGVQADYLSQLAGNLLSHKGFFNVQDLDVATLW
jgi:hypothetical protein